jgi:predicted DNA-binding mobile mystery protein A
MPSSELGRRTLDRRLAALRDLEIPTPPRGWIRALRDGLGMSAADLGRRMGMTRQAISQLERSEAEGSIRLDTLRRAAEALGSELVYALVPKDSLEDTVKARARAVAERTVEGVEHTMALEAQTGGVQDRERLVDELAERLEASNRLWSD